METLEAIGKRASLKACLSAREVEKEKIVKILEAARLAPSARNSQPWRYGLESDTLDNRVLCAGISLLSLCNQLWARGELRGRN